MQITTHSAQIVANDNKGSCGANINHVCSGYVADLMFWGDAIYVARRRGDSALHILIAPRAIWKDDIRNEGYEIVGKLSRIATTNQQPQ